MEAVPALLACLILLCNCARTGLEPDAWQRFKALRGREYGAAATEDTRRGIWQANLAKAASLTTSDGEGGALFNAYTKFGDMTRQEFRDAYLTAKPSGRRHNATVRVVPAPRSESESVDWTWSLPPVKDQGGCGSCWAFACVACLESAWTAAGYAPASFSEQQLVDCSGSYGTLGCSGGWMSDAFAYMEDHYIKETRDYPYVGRKQRCTSDSHAMRHPPLVLLWLTAVFFSPTFQPARGFLGTG